MDGWLSSGIKLLDLMEAPPEAPKVFADGIKDLKFGQGQLGFTIELMHVVSVDKERQAARLGVEVGDRLTKVDGRAVPDFDAGDVEAGQEANDLVLKWLEEMPRPAMIQFVGEASSADAAAASGVDSSEAEGVARPTDLNQDTSWKISGEDSAQASIDLGSGLADPGAEASDAAACDWDVETLDPALLSEMPTADSASAEPTQKAVPERFDSLSGLPSTEALLQLVAEPSESPDGDGPEKCDLEDKEAKQDEARQAWVKLTASLEAERHQNAMQHRKLLDLRAQLAAARDENKDLLMNAKHSEAAVQRAVGLEAQIAEKSSEIESLTKALEDARSELLAADARAATAEANLSTVERQLEVSNGEMDGLRSAYEAETELLRREQSDRERQHQQQLEEATQRLEEQQQKASQELQQVREEVRSAQEEVALQRRSAETAAAEAAAAAIEAAAARMEAAKQVSAAEKNASCSSKATPKTDDEDDWTKLEEAMTPLSAGSESPSNETAALYDRINLLERRCCYLQNKLNAKPLSRSDLEGISRSSLLQRPAWEPWLVSVVGTRAAELLITLYMSADSQLRIFTQRLLKRDMWLWVFYLHLFVLYLISGTCYAYENVDPNSPVDAINARIDRVAHEDSIASRGVGNR